MSRATRPPRAGRAAGDGARDVVTGGPGSPAAAEVDRVVVVDWSASNRPRRGPDSIWVAEGMRGQADAIRAQNPPTRMAAAHAVTAILETALQADERVLVGVDFSFGYPRGFARTFPGTGKPWERVWRFMEARIADTSGNANNRFQVANDLNEARGAALFWGCPSPTRCLSPKLASPPPGLAPNPYSPLRVTEIAARAHARKQIKSNWQLFGGVSVGSQVLMGLPYLERLRRLFGRAMAVWPFETGFASDPFVARPGARIVLAEVWPTAFDPPGAGRGRARDEEQVRWAVRSCLQHQEEGGLGEWFDPPSVRELPGDVVEAVVEEEGWILGVR